MEQIKKYKLLKYRELYKKSHLKRWLFSKSTQERYVTNLGFDPIQDFEKEHPMAMASGNVYSRQILGFQSRFLCKAQDIRLHRQDLF